ncbi:flagellin lysine-N-methylase [Clostridium sp.]|jgi:lysine-N-methylase|uniref:flagellin lysine-N-methylase n=1 Tax=Clostridium sp. TaxID=1506 RepID=UPI0025C2A3F4|nr:flagellin lysine-N-methylase [Clostridium sp.]MCI9070716.1 lysine-N-methylase [Clostridium sp.]
MKVNMFMPKYMLTFKCIGSKCVDTCCAGWDINIDEDTYKKYINCTGELKDLVKDKFKENKNSNDYFNKGFMILKEHNKCPFLNDDLLCDIHGNVGEDNLCITCKRFPRVYNIVDDIYEKSGLASCPEVCIKAFLNKDKMEFVENNENLDESAIEIRRIIDSEAFEGSDSLLQYFWDIRISSINIIQNRDFSIEQRLSILKSFYNKIEKYYIEEDFDKIEELLELYNEEKVNFNLSKVLNIEIDNEFYLSLLDEDLIKNIKSIRLKECVEEYKKGISKIDNIKENINNEKTILHSIDEYSYILENYLVNQIFKDLIPFNKGESLNLSVTVLINSYKIIKCYIIGIALNNKEINKDLILRVIQSLSKDIEHNKVFKNLLESEI